MKKNKENVFTHTNLWYVDDGKIQFNFLCFNNFDASVT